MSKDRFKPISDAFRAALRALDETPEQHRKEMLLRSKTPVRELNRHVLTRKTVTRAEREAEAKRLAEARRPQYPDARVMFVEHTICLSCGAESEGMSHPLIFLRLRSLLPGQSKFDPSQLRYVPENEYVDFPGAKLPKIIEHHTTKVAACPKCFTNAVHSFRNETIESSPGNQEAPPSSTEGELKSSPPLTTGSNMAPAEKSGTPDLLFTSSEKSSPSELTTGTGSTSFPRENPSASAQPIHTLITEVKELAASPTEGWEERKVR